MIREESGKYCLYTADGSKKIACHDTRQAAEAQERAIQVAKHASELIPRDVLAHLCPSCDKKLGERVTAVRFDSLPQKTQYLLASFNSAFESLSGNPNFKAMVTDPGFFTHCINDIAPKSSVDDPEAFCAWLHNQVTGEWPTEHASEIKQLQGYHKGHEGHAGHEVSGSGSNADSRYVANMPKDRASRMEIFRDLDKEARTNTKLNKADRRLIERRREAVAKAILEMP